MAFFSFPTCSGRALMLSVSLAKRFAISGCFANMYLAWALLLKGISVPAAQKIVLEDDAADLAGDLRVRRVVNPRQFSALRNPIA